MNWNAWLAVAAVNGLISVAAGAFGAHGLRDKLSPRYLEIFETAARYQMYHVFALVAVAWLASRQGGWAVSGSGWCFLIGIVLFSGSLYALALSGVERLGMITPMGGALMIIGWGLLAWAAIRAGP
ncbi:MAG: DUF423 domain-containing protein [Phycisphaerae bacterium]